MQNANIDVLFAQNEAMVPDRDTLGHTKRSKRSHTICENNQKLLEWKWMNTNCSDSESIFTAFQKLRDGTDPVDARPGHKAHHWWDVVCWMKRPPGAWRETKKESESWSFIILSVDVDMMLISYRSALSCKSSLGRLKKQCGRQDRTHHIQDISGWKFHGFPYDAITWRLMPMLGHGDGETPVLSPCPNPPCHLPNRQVLWARLANGCAMWPIEATKRRLNVNPNSQLGSSQLRRRNTMFNQQSYIILTLYWY